MQCIQFLKQVELGLLSMYSYIYSSLNTFPQNQMGSLVTRKITDTSFRMAGAPTEI
jgi:hypothetical protein